MKTEDLSIGLGPSKTYIVYYKGTKIYETVSVSQEDIRGAQMFIAELVLKFNGGGVK